MKHTCKKRKKATKSMAPCGGRGGRMGAEEMTRCCSLTTIDVGGVAG